MTKTCYKCLEEKNLELFAKGSKYADGRKNICKKCHAEYISQYYKDRPDKYKEKVRINSKYKANWKRHKISEEKYLELLALYEGKCHGCQERKATNIDHDHSCCKARFSCGNCVRGVLCNQCNTALGLLSDDAKKLQTLLKYIS
jgi:hypothetical protein